MMDKNKIAKQLDDLITQGRDIHMAGIVQHKKDYFIEHEKGIQERAKNAVKNIKNYRGAYHAWYNDACNLVSIFIPKRLEEFEKLYTGNKTIKNYGDLNPLTAGIFHYIRGDFARTNDDLEDFFNTFVSNFIVQVQILEAIEKNIDNDFFRLETDIRRGVYESEIDIAEELQENGHLRVAGAIAGIVIEVHLKQVVINRKLPLNSDKPKISNYTSVLKSAGRCDKPLPRLIDGCNKIRNKCVHPDKGEPTDDEISRIIRDAKIILEDVH